MAETQQSSEFELQGFLCPIEGLLNNSEFNQLCTDWISLYRDVNEMAMLTFYSAKVDGGSSQKIFANVVFVRLLTNYQCTFRLAEIGLGAECRGIMRSLLEALVALQATEKVPDFHERFHRHSQNEHRRMLQKLKDLNLLDAEGIIDLEGLQHFSRRDALPWTDIAKYAGLSDMFNMQYTRLCKHAHPDAFGLIDGFQFNEANEAVGTALCPDFVDADHNLMTTIGFMLMALGSMNRLFQLGHIEGLATFLARHRKLMEQLKSSRTK
jgi:hypothetical protein